MLRSALAVLAGIATLTAASFAIEALLDPLLLWAFPFALPDRAAINRNLPASLLLFVCTTACITLGAYVSARIARRAPLTHAIIMGAIQTGLTVWAMLSIGHLAPTRNWVLSLIFTLPAAVLGGLLCARRTRKVSAPISLPSN
jgi:hypothetical protein